MRQVQVRRERLGGQSSARRRNVAAVCDRRISKARAASSA